MSSKKPELLLIAAALFVCGGVILFGTVLSPAASPLAPVAEMSTYTAPTTKMSSGERVNLNTAQVDELATLKGIGKSKAQAIIDYRNENGDFTDIYELRLVEGIGESIIEQNLSRIYV